MNKITICVAKEILHPLLFDYLLYNNWLLPFVHNWKQIDDEFKKKHMSFQISDAFDYSKSKEGFEYWETIERKFILYWQFFDRTDEQLRNNLISDRKIFEFIHNILLISLKGNLYINDYSEMDWFEQLIFFNWTKSEQGFDYWEEFLIIHYPIRYKYSFFIRNYRYERDHK